MTEFDAVILADGAFPTAEEPLRLLREAPYVVCCDGAVRHWPQCDAIVGDGDSVPEEQRSRLTQIDEQEDNDLTKATRYCMAQGFRRIVYLGATGRREDHTLGNISLLLVYAREASCPVTMLTDYGRFETIFDTATLPSVPGQQISIFAFDNTLTIKSAGPKYPTDQVRFDTLWKATLNEALSSSFTLTLSHPSGVLLFFADHL